MPIRRLPVALLTALIASGLAAPALAAPPAASDSARAYTLNQIASKLRSRGLKCSGPERVHEGDDDGPARRQVDCTTKGILVGTLTGPYRIAEAGAGRPTSGSVVVTEHVGTR